MADLTVQVAALNLSAGHDPSESSESAAPSITILSPPHDATTIDKNGDLYLVVGDEKRAFQVDSRALVRVSSMWNAMVRCPSITFEIASDLYLRCIAYRQLGRI